MTTLLARFGLGPLAAAAAREPGFAPQALVLGGPEGLALAAALAGELRVRRRAGAALLAVWSPEGAEAAPLVATPAARDLAGRLTRRGVGAVARGRLAWLGLSGDPGDALALAVRAAAAVDVPFVLCLCGPRPRPVERILGEFDMLVIEHDEAGVSDLAVADLDARGVGAVACSPPRDVRRLVALAGWGRLRSAGRLGELVAALT
jgi:hypothetical protein